MTDGKKILLGISGGIAAYKTPQLVRLLRQAGADVQVVMTANARQFVTPTTLQAVSGRPVRDDLWDPAAEAAMGHIELARWADLILIAPATADVLSRLATGRADDLLLTLCLASRTPLYVAPAMNVAMWQHIATQRNVKQLTRDGVQLLGPEDGEQACGEFGPGRMLEPEAIVATLLKAGAEKKTEPSAALTRDALAGKKVVITAGPTREAIDPVRYISNHSSGRQGYALAEACLDRGADVVLISGPVAIAAPEAARLVAVESARDMFAAVHDELADCDLFISVAAVADYRPEAAASRKIKKEGQSHNGLDLTLVENPDIVASVASADPRPFVVGFAAETHNALEYARNKRARKGLDVIVVNDVANPDIGFNSSENAATVIWSDGETCLPQRDKLSLANAILDEITALYPGTGG